MGIKRGFEMDQWKFEGVDGKFCEDRMKHFVH